MKQSDVILTATATTTVTSVQYDLGDLLNYSISVRFSGSDLAGTLVLKACNDTSETPVTIPGSSQTIASAASHVWSVMGAGYRYVNVVWTYTSGTGNISARIIAKENVIKGA